jgi:hypothetical protein
MKPLMEDLMADIMISGTTKLGGAYGKTAKVYVDKPGVKKEYLGMSNSDGSFCFYPNTTGFGTYQIYTENSNGLEGPKCSWYFDGSTFEWEVGDVTIYGFRLAGTTKYNSIEGISGRPVLFKYPGANSYESLGISGSGGVFSYDIEPEGQGTCYVKSKNPYDEEGTASSFAYQFSSYLWNVGTLSIPILRLNAAGNVYVSKDYPDGPYTDMDIQVFVSNECSTQSGTEYGDWRNTRNFATNDWDTTGNPYYSRIGFSGSALYLPTTLVNTTLFVYSRDHECPSGPEDVPMSNVVIISPISNEHDLSGLTLKHPPDLVI